MLFLAWFGFPPVDRWVGCLNLAWTGSMGREWVESFLMLYAMFHLCCLGGGVPADGGRGSRSCLAGFLQVISMSGVTCLLRFGGFCPALLFGSTLVLEGVL